MLDWEDLRHFAALARDGSLSAASRRLRVDHATVARRVAALEAALGLKLVDRRPRAYVLTPEGERVAALAAGMEDQAFAIGRAARAVQPGLVGEVSVSAPPVLSTTLIAPRLGLLRARHPGIRIHLIGEKRSASLSRREADVVVRLSRPAERSLVIRKLGTMRFGLYASADYLAAHAPDEFAFIAYDEGADELPQQRWLKAVAGSRPVVLRMSELEGQRVAARAGVGLAALPCFLGDRDGDLVKLDIEGAPVREIWLAVHGDLHRAAPVAAVMAFLAECLGQRELSRSGTKGKATAID